MPIALGLLLVVAEMTSPVQGQPPWTGGSAAERKESARKRFEATEAGLKGLGEARLETIREMWGAAWQEFVYGRQQRTLGSLLAVIQAWQEAIETHLEPGPARERELVQFGNWLRVTEQISWAKWENGSLNTSDLLTARWHRLLFEYDLRKNRLQADLPSAAAGSRLDPFFSDPPPAFRRAEARARFETSQADLGQVEQKLLEIAREGLQATAQEFVRGHQMPSVVDGWLRRVQWAERMVAERGHPRRELLEREWLASLDMERFSQAKFLGQPPDTAEGLAVRLSLLRFQVAMALAGEVQPATQRRRVLSFALDQDAKPKDRWVIQESFAGTETPLSILRQQQLQTAENYYQAVLKMFLDGRQRVTVSTVAWRALLPLEASLELHEEKADSLLLALRCFQTALEEERIAIAQYEVGSLSTASLFEARFNRLSYAVRLLQVSQPRPER